MKRKHKHKKAKSFPACDLCNNKKCREGKDCFNIREHVFPEYQREHLKLARVSSDIEAKHYMRKTRLEELMLFANEMGFQKLGIAFCIGLSEEAEILAGFLRKTFDVVSVCCKVCGIDKNDLDFKKKTDTYEAMCNPIGQALLLNRHETDLNIICGLCIGHDIQFTNHSEAPVTTFIVKDRILAHNTAASLYCHYLRKRLS
jgi:uncharacterized metal-binding protein